MAKRPGTPNSASAPVPTAEQRVVLLSGADVFLAAEWQASLRRALEKAHGPIDTFTLQGPSIQPADLLDECRSYGLMAGHKLVVLDEAEAFLAAEDRREKLVAYAAAPAQAATLVIRGVSRAYPRLSAAVVEGGGVVVDCKPPDEARAIDWIIRRTAKRHNAELPPDVARAMVAQLGPDLGKLDAEAAKFAVAAGPGERITMEIAAALGGGRREVNPFWVQNALGSGDPAAALRAVREVHLTSPRDAYVPLAIAAARLAADRHARASPNQLPAAKAMLDLALQADVNNKSGIGDPVRTMEILALRFGGFGAGTG